MAFSAVCMETVRNGGGGRAQYLSTWEDETAIIADIIHPPLDVSGAESIEATRKDINNRSQVASLRFSFY